MLSANVPLLLGTVTCLLLSGSFASEEPSGDPDVHVFTNVSVAQVGKPFKVTCELANYLPKGEHFIVYFHRSGGQYNGKYSFFRYDITAPYDTNIVTHSYNMNGKEDFSASPLSSSFPVYEITVTNANATSNAYWCNLYIGKNSDGFNSTRQITVNTTVPLPTALFTSNESALTSGHPFTTTCTVNATGPLVPEHFALKWYSLRDGQLATYEVKKGKALLSWETIDTIDVTSGLRSSYPTFDLVLTEKKAPFTLYWCTLEIIGKSAPAVKSNVWPEKGALTFTAPVGGANATQRVGTCAVDGALNPAGKPYTVQFWTDLGPKSVNLLAEYIIKPDHPVSLNWKHVLPWGTISNGESTSWPTFSIVLNGSTRLHRHWWCLLAIGQPDSPDYREIVSNIGNL